MTGRPSLAEDGRTLTVRVPLTMRKRGGRKLVVAPAGAAYAPPRVRVDNTMAKALARAYRWKRLIESGRYTSVAELAGAERINQSYLCRVLRLTLLAPDIVEAKRTASSDTNQIRIFYEADATALFITFSGGKMHWCRAARGVELLAGDGRMRRTVDGWRSESAGGKPLTTDRLSGGLLKVQGFRGTICRVQARDYLVRKINDEVSPEVAAAEDAERAMTSAIVGLIRRLTWQDFELLVELVFSNSGWRRIGVVGRTQKTADIELVLPTTDERAFVQIKSAAGDAELRDYEARFAAAPAYDRMFFIWHTGHLSAEAKAPGITLLGPDRLARMVLDAGLASWLREKVS